MIDAIDALIEWIANDSGSAVATLFPFLLLGLVGLWLLWLVLGYLRVSQVGLADDAAHGTAVAVPPALPDTSGGPVEAPRGIPYCPVDGTRYAPGAVYCTRDESSLVVNCANCGTRIGASDDRCYHCGTTSPQIDVSD